MSFYKYGELYDALQASGRHYPEYELIELFLTLHGARPACLLTLKTLELVTTFRTLLAEKSIPFIEYPYKPNYIVISPYSKRELIMQTLPIIRAAVFEIKDGKQILVGSDEDIAAFHTATGRLIGYMRPMNILEVTGGKSAYLQVEIDGTPIAGIMPQRVADATDEEIRAYFKPKMDLLEDLHKNPDKYFMPFKISKPELIIKAEPVRNAVGSARHKRFTRTQRSKKSRRYIKK
jgi:hypothetical protein